MCGEQKASQTHRGARTSARTCHIPDVAVEPVGEVQEPAEEGAAATQNNETPDM